jgi:hypothetical protein
VLGVLNAELPGTSVALLDRHGARLAGREVGARVLVEVEVPDGDGGVLGVLAAGGPARSPGWPSVVRAVLRLAVAPLMAWAATERLSASRDFARQAALARRLLAGADEGARAAAVALGWAVAGPVAAFLVRPVIAATAGDDAEARAVIAATVGEVPVVRRAEGWAGWSALPVEELAGRLERCAGAMPWPCAAGVGAVVAGLEAVAESLEGARAAAFVAGRGAVARADRMGPAELLGALPAGVLKAPATVVLGPLLAVDRDGTLLETLAAVLEEGGAIRAAERLGVHRNTVTTRLERIRAAGFDLDDPSARLALQLACHVLLR